MPKFECLSLSTHMVGALFLLYMQAVGGPRSVSVDVPCRLTALGSRPPSPATAGGSCQRLCSSRSASPARPFPTHPCQLTHRMATMLLLVVVVVVVAKSNLLPSACSLVPVAQRLFGRSGRKRRTRASRCKWTGPWRTTATSDLVSLSPWSATNLLASQSENLT